MYVVIAVGGYLSNEIPFESDPNPYALIPEADRVALESFEKAFNQGEPMVLIVMENPSKWDSYADFQALETATNWWKKKDTVVAMSLTNVPFPVMTFLGIKKRPFARLENESNFQRWYDRADKFADITTKFLSKNREYALIFVPSSAYTAKKSKQFQQQFCNDNVTVLPLDYEEIQDELQATNERETAILAAISLGIILLVFFVLTGSLRGLWFIFTLTCFSLSLTALFVFFSGMIFSVHMVAIPCMLIVLSFTDLMHLLYTQEALRKTSDSDRSLRAALAKSLHRPMLLTSLTNMIGFILFLYLANNGTLRDISLLSIVGVVFAFLSSRFVALQVLRTSDSFFPRGTGKKWQAFHERILQKLYPKRKRLLLLSTLATLLLGVLLYQNVSVGNVPFVVEGKAPSFKAVNALSDHFFGDKTASIHLEFERPEEFWSEKNMLYLEKLEASIESKFHPIALSSPTVIAKRYHRFERGGHPGAFSFPNNYDSLFQLNTQNFGGGGVINSEEHKARIQFSFLDLPLEASLAKMSALEQFLLKNPPPDGMTVKLSGSALLNDRATYHFSLNILYGLLLSVLFGALLTFFFVRSGIILLATLIANTLPLFVALIVMHYFGSALNPISLFFFTVIMGLCVDDSIYLIVHRNVEKQSSIYPIAITSAVLAIGFASFLFSAYAWIRPFGWVFLVAILVAFAFDALLLVLFTKRNSTFDSNV